MSNTPPQWWHKRWITPIPSLPEDAAWAALSAPGVLEARITALRLEAAPAVCTACGSSAVSAQKWCPGCQRMLAHPLFSRDRTRADGLRWDCRECERRRHADRRRRRALRALGIAS